METVLKYFIAVIALLVMYKVLDRLYYGFFKGRVNSVKEYVIYCVIGAIILLFFVLSIWQFMRG